MNDIFNRARLLVGEKGMERIAQSRVLLFGVGGVGSWCAESLVRSGISHLTIVDADTVNITNVNRQLMATTRTVGQVKVNALKERLLEINPEADITPVQKLFTAENAAEFQLDSYDYIIDCIDSLKDKTALIELASHSPATLFSSMGAALKIDPTRIRVAEFWNVNGDPLARAIRKKFRKEGRTTGKPVLCVYSEELLENRGEAEEPSQDDIIKKACVNGSLAHITAIFGHTLAGLVLKDIIARGDN
ncbi:MAG TPA: tRNA threonylcarbamoyladenosine dehydratase [Rikenellaceae bacterium]|nr:tRNA threonylcarbamoyladenosine dehydratase [Rikenellaceae bacterium]